MRGGRLPASQVCVMVRCQGRLRFLPACLPQTYKASIWLGSVKEVRRSLARLVCPPAGEKGGDEEEVTYLRKIADLLFILAVRLPASDGSFLLACFLARSSLLGGFVCPLELPSFFLCCSRTTAAAYCSSTESGSIFKRRNLRPNASSSSAVLPAWPVVCPGHSCDEWKRGPQSNPSSSSSSEPPRPGSSGEAWTVKSSIHWCHVPRESQPPRTSSPWSHGTEISQLSMFISMNEKLLKIFRSWNEGDGCR